MQEFTISDAISLVHILIIGPLLFYLAIKKHNTPRVASIVISILSICLSIFHIYMQFNKHKDTDYLLIIPIGGICIVLIQLYAFYMIQIKK